jgi:hypothetical protein
MRPDNSGERSASLLRLTGPESLTADQRAVLQLLLLRGQSYSQIATALRSDSGTVRTRAHEALLSFEPALPAEVSEADAAALRDDVLGQPSRVASGLLDRSAPARTWHDTTREGLVAAGFAKSAATAPAAPVVPEQGDTVSSSRTAGAVLLGLVAAGLVLVILWVAGVFDSGTAAPSATGTTTTGPTTGTQILGQINLRPTNGGSAKGAAIVLEQDGTRGIEVVGEGLAPSSFYALWTQQNGRWQRIGFFPAVRPDGPDKGKLSGSVIAPENILDIDRMVVSRERVKEPKTPNAIVLSGKLAGS